MAGRLTRADKHKLLPWMGLSGFAFGLASALIPSDGLGNRTFAAVNIATLVQGIVWFTYLHWNSAEPRHSPLAEFALHLLVPPAVGLPPALAGVALLRLLGF